METRKTEIINTSARLFKEKGYSAVSMRDLASEMGMKAASLYNHINSKEDILNSIILSIAEDFTAGMKQIKTSNKSPIDKVTDVIKLHVLITSENPYGMASLNNDWMHLGAQLDYYLDLRYKYEDEFRKILNEGVGTGEFKQVDVEVMLFSILSTLRSLYLWIPKKADLDVGRLATELGEVLITGINK